MTNPEFTRRIIAASAALGLALCGCEDRRRHQASETVALSVVTPALAPDAAPADVVRALFDTLAEAQRARRAGLSSADRRETYDRAMGRLAGMADREVIYARVKEIRSYSMPRDVAHDAALRRILQSWVSISAYYMDGLKDANILAVNSSPDAVSCHVLADVTRPEDRQRLHEIESRSDVAASHDKDPSTFHSALQAKAVEQGLAFPVEARLEVTLQREKSGPWRVAAFMIGPSPSGAMRVSESAPQATTMPAPAN